MRRGSSFSEKLLSSKQAFQLGMEVEKRVHDISLISQLILPITHNLALAQSFEAVLRWWGSKELKWMGKVILSTNVSDI